MKIKKLKTFYGFTLIELLVVIAIIGILASIVYAPFQTARRKGRDAQKVIEMKNLLASINLYADSNNGHFPTSLVVLESSQSEPIPVRANRTGTQDPNLYNYQPFFDAASMAGNVIGFHLWTHLETANTALAGAAKCDGILIGTGLEGEINTGPTTQNPCISLAEGSIYAGTNVPGAQAPVNSNFLEENRTATNSVGLVYDSDKNCATDLTSCILDYHQ